MLKKIFAFVGKFFDDNPLLAILLFAVLSPLIAALILLALPGLWLGEKLGLPDFLSTLLALCCLVGGLYLVFQGIQNGSGSAESGCIGRNGNWVESC